MSLQARIEYETAGFDVADALADPLAQWWRWFHEADEAGCVEPHAMVVATVGLDGVPDTRNVLTRGADERGLVFFTNYESAKSQQLSAHPVAAAHFSWLALHRQVKMRGEVERVTAEESDAYWVTRPRLSQIGSAASPQSQPLPDRAALEARVAELDRRFHDHEVPRPAHWGGWRIVPTVVEFWQGRPSRLHDRVVYTRGDGGTWSLGRLAP